MDLSTNSKIRKRAGDGRMKHIVSFSGGKDSSAMLIRMIEEGMRIN
jgi:tRNA(Ile)-lysidine synthase TilS/MesJ